MMLLKYNKLVAKVNSNDTSRFVLKTNYDTDKTERESKIPNTSDLVKKVDYNTKTTEIKVKILNASSLATKTTLTAVENKIPDVSSLVKKTDYDTKITEIEKKLTDHNHDKYITTPEFNTMATSVFSVRLAHAKLVTKKDFDNRVSSLDSKILVNKPKNDSIENELKKRKTFNSGYFIGKSHFEEDGSQNYLVFQPINRYFKVIANTDYICDYYNTDFYYNTDYIGNLMDYLLKLLSHLLRLTPALGYYGTKTRVKFTGSCLKQPNISYTDSTIVNIYIVYELDASSFHNNDPTQKNCLFGAVTLTKNADIDKY